MKKSNGAKLSNVGIGLAGLAATAYFFLGPKGKKNQSSVKSWVIKMKGDVVEKLEQARDITEPVYKEIIDTVAARHKKVMKNNEAEIAELAQDLKKHWRTISQSAKTTKNGVVSDSKKLVKEIASTPKKLMPIVTNKKIIPVTVKKPVKKVIKKK